MSQNKDKEPNAPQEQKVHKPSKEEIDAAKEKKEKIIKNNETVKK